MASFLPIISLLLVIVISLMVVRIATIALVLTGISHQLAQFQARSAFTGAGFTTSESDKVTQHPVRRKIIMLLMLLGNAGIVTAVSSLMLSFVSTSDENPVNIWLRFGFLGVGLVILWFVTQSQWIDQRLNNLVEWALRRWTDLEVADYSNLLHLGHGFSVVEMGVEEDDWLVERDLAGLRLSEEGVLVLGIERPGEDYVGAPRGTTRLQAGDTVILYGPRDILTNLDERRAGSTGNWDHHKAVDRQLKAQREQAEKDAEEEENAAK
ncbi:TrkA C-terminal domain-containing protein [Bremerella sp. T1]|uniref:TrkA C-terminal domain-containing protein n=1 Tax=Bremerella sp. TYQ1 TaxID=3119568 RepID=UPI001CCB1B57|nr:TrkA C-terminal domain-containing protein [Bremerella volcania]UBM34361.1 TrkA C-terminal domain-containing protein [Bremerella volcania]